MAAQRNGGIVDTNGNRIMTKRALMQDFDIHTLKKSNFNQAPLDFLRAQWRMEKGGVNFDHLTAIADFLITKNDGV